MDLARFKRQFPFTVDVTRCPECGEWMERARVRDPLTQEHWRGISAYVCTADACDYAERIDD